MADQQPEALFECEGRPVYAGNVLHVSPAWHGKAGAICEAYRPAYDGMATVRSIPSGAVPTVPVDALSWAPHPDVTDRETIAEATGDRPSRITNRDLFIWRTLRAQVERPQAAGQVAAPAMVPLSNDQIQKLFREKHWYELGEHPFTWGAASVVIRAAEQLLGVSTPTYLQADDLQWLQRFKGTTEDDQSYDVPKDAMKRLAELGVVRSEGFGRYSITAFGSHAADPSDQFARLPLKTHADHEADYKTAFNAKHGLTVGGIQSSGRVGK